ncbi:MAG: hypothetical protein WD060_05770 [Pirellulales bacterium]
MSIAPPPRLVVTLPDGLAPRAAVVPIIAAWRQLGGLRRSWACRPRFPFAENRPIVVTTTSPPATAAAAAAPAAPGPVFVAIAGFAGAALHLATWLIAGRPGGVPLQDSVVTLQRAVVALRRAVITLWRAVVPLWPAVLVESAGRTLGAATAVVPPAFCAKLLFRGRRHAWRRFGRTGSRPRRGWSSPARNAEFGGQAVPITGRGRGLGLERLLSRFRRGRLRPGDRGTRRVVGREGAE